MGHGSSDVHAAQAERAERLAEDALRRLTAARDAAEHHERLASDEAAGEWHHRAAALCHAAALIYEQAVALQFAHASHERTAAAAPSVARFAGARGRPSDLAERSAALTLQEALADQRDRTAGTRELAADEREPHNPPPSLRFAADQRLQLERIQAALVQLHDAIWGGAHALHRDDPDR
jgi:hypothetical protein